MAAFRTANFCNLALERKSQLRGLIQNGVAAAQSAWNAAAGALRGSVWAVADQGVVSACSLAFNIVLARTVPERDFGVVVLAIGGIYLLQSVHRAFVLYPLSLRVATSHPDGVRNLALSSVALSLPLSLLLGLAAAGVALTMSHPLPVALALVALVFVSQSHEMLRSVFLARMQHHQALVADILRHGTAVAGVAVLSRYGGAGVLGAFACLAVGAVLGAAWQTWRLRLWSGQAHQIPILASDAWRLGRWDLLGGALSTFAAQIMPWGLAAWHGAAATARLQAVASLLGATHPVMFGLNSLVTPAVAAAAGSGRANPRKAGLRYALIGCLALCPYFAVLLLLPHISLSIVYGSASPYSQQAAPLRWFTVMYAFVYVLNSAQSILYGLGRSRDVSFISFAGLFLQSMVVLPLAIQGGLLVACVAMAAAQLVHAAIAVRFVYRAPVYSHASYRDAANSEAAGSEAEVSRQQAP